MKYLCLILDHQMQSLSHQGTPNRGEVEAEIIDLKDITSPVLSYRGSHANKQQVGCLVHIIVGLP